MREKIPMIVAGILLDKNRSPNISSYVISDSKQCKQQWPTEAIAFIKY